MSVKKPEDINLKQKEFYETKKKNLATKTWFALRNGILRKVRKDIGVEKQIHQLHMEWCGDLSNKKVLDLGCYEGNSLSMHLAQNSKKYIAIDLSEKGISYLRTRIKDIPNSKAFAIDFLSEEFTEKNFDLIYAYGVLHHFKDVEGLISRLNDKLSSRGIIISNDPLQTSIPIKIIRALYRPFQSDKDWEWPFSKKVYYQFDSAFKIKDRRAMLGKSKWFFMINFLPFSAEKKAVIIKKWHREDWERSKSSDANMFKCMHLTMLMQKKN
ncbi:class I SAM-dependent methyltransferase [Gillisia sp. JM1]|uniref:class I SAM-dependent methyltransferase n=1 Tax=Gillisia sp. JM1 TaxID=1283286 RepID=UPI0004251759|nr:class I SAM-dependent methyltransferase [Gillisia sp. JM1]